VYKIEVVILFWKSSEHHHLRKAGRQELAAKDARTDSKVASDIPRAVLFEKLSAGASCMSRRPRKRPDRNREVTIMILFLQVLEIGFRQRIASAQGCTSAR